MSVEATEVKGGQGGWFADLDFSELTYSQVTDESGRPLRLAALIYDADDQLVYPPMPMLSAIKTPEGSIKIGGAGSLWYMGAEGVGPPIEDLEFVSGGNKLSNPVFAYEDANWRVAGEGSQWAVTTGLATNVGGFDGDDVLESDERWPARPGNEYRSTAGPVTGNGRVKTRTIYEGKFKPPNLWINGDLSSGGTGYAPGANVAVIEDYEEAYGSDNDYVVRQLPIPKPQLVVGSDFSVGWTLGATMSAAGGQLLIEETPKPQYIPHAGSGDFTVSPYVTYENTDPTKAIGISGYYRKIGPIGQHQVVINGSFESGLTGWTQYAGAWSTSSATHVDGANSATTGGVGGGGKNLQASIPLPVEEGEEWTVQGYLASGTIGTSDEADGECHLQFYVVDAAGTGPNLDSWITLVTLRGDDLNKDQWHFGQGRFTGQPDKTHLVPMITVYGHSAGAGSWYADGIQMIRTRGNNTGIYSADFAAIPNQRYQFWLGFVKSDPRIGGSITLRLIFKGPGVEDFEVRSSAQSHTFGKWTSLSVDGTCPKGYDTVGAAIDGDDIVGGSFYVDADYTKLYKADNNTDRATGTTVPVTVDQRYSLAATIEALTLIEGGTVTIGVTFSGPGVDDEVEFEEHAFRDDETPIAVVSREVRPREGYTSATPFVLARDLSGGEGGNVVAVRNLTLTKLDNNRDAITASVIGVTPERTYKARCKVRSSPGLQRGNVRLETRCIRAGYPDVSYPSSAMDATDDVWKDLEFSVTPESGYDQLEPKLIFTDVEGGSFFASRFSLVDTDTGTVVFEGALDSPTDATTFRDSVAPDGTEFVRTAVVVEKGGTGWRLGGASLARKTLDPATGEDVVAALLIDQSTNLPLPLEAGLVLCPNVLPFDWRILHDTNRGAWGHFVSVVSEPTLGYRLRPAIPALIDVGPEADIFEDHHADSDNPIILDEDDIDVMPMRPTTNDVANRPTHVTLIGVERETVGGQRVVIGATAEVPGDPGLDPGGNPIHRVVYVSDGTVDHKGYAQAYAQDRANQLADPDFSVTVTLKGDRRTRPGLGIGDWIYPHSPKAKLVDPANEVSHLGEVIHPRRLQTQIIERKHGPGHRLVLVAPDGATFEPEGIQWSTEDSTQLTLGDALPQWRAHPGGDSVRNQYLRDRGYRPT